MKLTLRTLLAYMDEVLEPSMQHEMKQRVTDSEPAKAIIVRVDRAVRNPLLAAPDLSGKRMVIDPNRIAEYLDTVMPSENVEDFEKQALNADVLLAELGSCHHILKMILETPVRPDANRRDKIHDLLQKVKERQEAAARAPAPEPVHTPEEVAASVLAPAPTPDHSNPAGKSKIAPGMSKISRVPVSVESGPPKPVEIPEYLKESTPLWRHPVVLGLVALAAAVALFFSFGGMSLLNPTTAVVENTNPVNPTPGTGSATTPAESTTPAPGSTTVEMPPESVPPNPNPATNVPMPEVTTPVPAVPLPAVPMTTTPTPEPVTPNPNPANPNPANPNPGNPTPANPTPANPNPVNPMPMPMPMVDPTVPKVVEPMTTMPPKAVKELGLYTTADSVILLHKVIAATQKADWQRLPPRATVYSGDLLVSSPTFRSVLDLSLGVTLELVGCVSLQLDSVDEDGTLNVRVGQGKILLTGTKDGAKVRFRSGSQSWVVTFPTAQAQAAVEFIPTLPQGTDPEKVLPMLRGFFYGTAKETTWEDSATMAKVTAIAPCKGSLVPLELFSGAETLTWLDPQAPIASKLDIRGGESLRKELLANESGLFRLTEFAEDRRREVRVLALQILAQMNQFDGLVESLNDESLPSVTREEIMESLHQSLARGPESVQAVKSALEKLHKDRSVSVFRMFWGYTDGQLTGATKEAERLIGYLDHESFVFRSVAYWNLRKITGLTLGYNPLDPPVRRAEAVDRWTQKLADGSIKHKEGTP